MQCASLMQPFKAELVPLHSKQAQMKPSKHVTVTSVASQGATEQSQHTKRFTNHVELLTMTTERLKLHVHMQQGDQICVCTHHK